MDFSESKKITFNNYKDNVASGFKNEFLDEETYKKVLESFVIPCTDIAIINREKKLFYLAYRKNKPIDGWWIIGGRRQAGKLPKEAASDCFERETSLKLPEDRFNFISINEYIFNQREQDPQDMGSHTLSHTFYVELSPDEINKASQGLTGDEFDQDKGLKEFDGEKLKDKNIHQSIIDLYQLIFESGN